MLAKTHKFNGTNGQCMKQKVYNLYKDVMPSYVYMIQMISQSD